MSIFKKLGMALVSTGTMVLLAACHQSGEVLDEAEETAAHSDALSTEQCNYYNQNGTVTICHATGSASKPYAITRVSTSACINAHSNHAGDHVAVNGDCGPNACLSEGGPVDGTIGCCPGLVVVNGHCANLCAGVTCVASDQCHDAGTCDPATGACSDPVAPDGTACSISGNPGSCAAGSCAPACNYPPSDVVNLDENGNVIPLSYFTNTQVSANGRYVVFGGWDGPYLRDRQACGATRIANMIEFDPQPQFFAGDDYVFIRGFSSAYPGACGRQVFRYNRLTGVTELVSATQDGEVFKCEYDGEENVDFFAASHDGRYALVSLPEITNVTRPMGHLGVFRKDMLTGELLSTPLYEDDGANWLSLDGQTRLLNARDALYLQDVASGTGSLVYAGTPGRISIQVARASVDGRYILFSSSDPAAVPAGVSVDPDTALLYRLDRTTGTTELLSRDPVTGQAPAGCSVKQIAVSEDGSGAVFQCFPNSTGLAGVFWKNATTGQLVQLSSDSKVGYYWAEVGLSGDGSTACYTDNASGNLICTSMP